MRRGVTVVEVLFAILIVTVGLFSVLVVFPFASSQAKRARVNDMLAAAGRSAFHDFDARGMRRPDRWLACNPVTGQFVPAQSTLQTTGFVESICIDPRMIAAHMTVLPVPPAPNPVWPATSIPTLGAQTSTGNPGGQCVQVFPFVAPGSTPYFSSPGVFNGQYMRRITLWSGALNNLGQKLVMSLPQADSIFLTPDDVASTRDEKDKSKPASQEFIELPTGEKIKRDSERKISWIATLVPQIEIRLINGVYVPARSSDTYTLSVVMIYDRARDLDNLEFPYPQNERVIKGALLSTGSTGGEVYLTASATPVAGASGQEIQSQLKIKPNQWVMVSGTHPAGITAFKWYRVSESDKEPALNGANYESYATLMGQDWNTSFVDLNPPASIAAMYSAGTGYPVNVTIVEGAMAVYEKAVRLEYGSSM